MTNHKQGKDAERHVKKWLTNQGLEALLMGTNCPYDLLVNGWRCEVKTSALNSQGAWNFNIHRHNVLNEAEVDFYILMLTNIPYAKGTALYIIKPAPIGVKVLHLTLRSLLRQPNEPLLQQLRTTAPPLTREHSYSLVEMEYLMARRPLESRIPVTEGP